MPEFSREIIGGLESHPKNLLFQTKRYVVFLISRNINEEWDKEGGYEKGALRYDSVKKKSEFIDFQQIPHFVFHNHRTKQLFYVHLDKKRDRPLFTIYEVKVLEEDVTEAVVFELDFYDSQLLDYSPYSQVEGWFFLEFTSLDSSYICVGLPIVQRSTRTAGNYNSLLLIDCRAKRIYKINESIGPRDSLLRNDQLYTYTIQNDSYFLFSTGRIGASEKEDLWQKGLLNRETEQQQVVALPLETFIDLIKKGKGIPDSFVIDECNQDSGIVHLTASDETICSHQHNYVKQVSTLHMTSMITKQKRMVEFKRKYAHMFFLGEGELYGIVYGHKGQEIYHISDANEPLLIDSIGRILLLQKEFIIYLTKENSDEMRLYDLKRKQLVYKDSMKGEYISIALLDKKIIGVG